MLAGEQLYGGSAGTLISTPNRVALLALGIALIMMAPRWAWRIGRLGVTAVHETGHAVAVVLGGGQVTAVHLRADTSGLTWHTGHLGRLARVVTAAAGYPAPGLLALAGAALVGAGHPAAWLGVLAGLALINLLLWVRNLFGMLVTAVAVTALAWMLGAGPPRADALVGAVAVWYLAIGGLRASYEAYGRHRAVAAGAARVPARGMRPGPGSGSARGPGAGQGRPRGAARAVESDAVELARRTRLPAGLWSGAFVVTALAAVGGCTALLVRFG